MSGIGGNFFSTCPEGAGGYRWRRKRSEAGAAAPHPREPRTATAPGASASGGGACAALRRSTARDAPSPPDEPRGHSIPRLSPRLPPRYLPRQPRPLLARGERLEEPSPPRCPRHPPPPASLLPAGWLPGQLSSSQRCSATPTTQGHSSTSQFRIGRRSRRPLPLRAGLSQRRRRDGPARPPAAPPRSAGPGSAAPRPPGAAVPPRPGRAAAARAAAAAAYSPHNAAGRRGSAAAPRVSHGGDAGEGPAVAPRPPHGVRLSETARLPPAAGKPSPGNRYSIIR